MSIFYSYELFYSFANIHRQFDVVHVYCLFEPSFHPTLQPAGAVDSLDRHFERVAIESSEASTEEAANLGVHPSMDALSRTVRSAFRQGITLFSYKSLS